MRLNPSDLFKLAGDFLAEDVGRGDITTEAVVLPGVRARGRFIAKQDLVVAGLEVADAVFAVLDSSVEIEAFVTDGDRVRAGDVFARVEGPAEVLLAAERTALNLLQHLSGIATLTRAFVEAVAGTRAQIVDTRKTLPGLRMLQKYAVVVGGGRNHRFGLDDGVLIKDNHIALAGSVRTAVERARKYAGHMHKIEVEVSNMEDLQEALDARADIILLDNMSPEEVREAVRLIRERAPEVLVEASGGITLENVRAYAEAGVDFISIGALTHSAPAADISMKLTTL
ncbi:MAG: carboxylating nicotinate-nucleotide diphosphorylase [Blastocatellia bacterium]|nr:carboxylating nicotinate-nucleotide diphosphorylase [Blastocatellia bacterium]MCS7156690.1 carboxylating nicotinate-nucleotide diphosphorylase [Blastocatellia bacterium]MDW8168668.1 carboxylating nicotinate-nucleotide diphosphorylase [Acidobacteriota bacterium]